MRPLTWLTADPALRLRLGEAGFEPEDFPFQEAWDVFVDYLNWPAALPDDASFQVARDDTGEEAPVTVSLVRQLTEEDDLMGRWHRAVALEFVFRPAELPIEPCEVWRSEYATLAEFVAAVEARTEFQLAASRPFIDSTIYQQEERAPDAGAA
jgi:hypothetical protein